MQAAGRAFSYTQAIIGRPQIFRNGFPGSRVDSSRAGITPNTLCIKGNRQKHNPRRHDWQDFGGSGILEMWKSWYRPIDAALWIYRDKGHLGSTPERTNCPPGHSV